MSVSINLLNLVVTLVWIPVAWSQLPGPCFLYGVLKLRSKTRRPGPLFICFRGICDDLRAKLKSFKP